MSIRWFAGGCAYDISEMHGVNYQEVMQSVWKIVDLVNMCEEIKIEFPSSYAEQEKVADGFKKKSWVQFNNCVGCVDGMLVWISQPSKGVMDSCDVGTSKFFCGRKKKFGMNLQAICDHELRFIDIDISHPASTSDYLAFCTSSILSNLEKDNFLKPGFCLYGDNAYVNTRFMASPFKGTSSGPKDAYNFFQSQIRINIECAFGVLVSRFGVLRKALPMNISIAKVSALIRCLCILHNFCINERLGKIENERENINENQETDYLVPPTDVNDSTNIMIAGGINLTNIVTVDVDNNSIENRMNELLDGGQHFNDTTQTFRDEREQQCEYDSLPRTKMLNKIIL